MGFAGRTSRWRSRVARIPAAAAIVVVATILAGVTAPAAPLYAEVYTPGDARPPANGGHPPDPGGLPDPGERPDPGEPPDPGLAPPYPGPDTSVVVSPKGWERALTKASLSTGFAPERVVENEKARFTATITYGRTPDPGPTVQVAYANDAELRSLEPGQFDVIPLTDTRHNLDEGSPDDKGGWSLSWSWDVIPRASGTLTLQLEIKPVVFMGGAVVDTLAKRNKPIKIDVMVHPHRARFDAVVSAGDKDFAPTAPPKATADDDAVVTADLPLHGNGQDVQVALSLTAADGSVPVVVRPKSTQPSPGQDAVHGEWVIRPGKEGVAKLAVAAVITTDVGDKTLEQRIERTVAIVVDPAPAFWPGLLAVVGGLTAVLTLLGAIATFNTQYRTHLTRLWAKVRRRPRPPGPPTSAPTSGTS